MHWFCFECSDALLYGSRYIAMVTGTAGCGSEGVTKGALQIVRRRLAFSRGFFAALCVLTGLRVSSDVVWSICIVTVTMQPASRPFSLGHRYPKHWRIPRTPSFASAFPRPTYNSLVGRRMLGRLMVREVEVRRSVIDSDTHFRSRLSILKTVYFSSPSKPSVRHSRGSLRACSARRHCVSMLWASVSVVIGATLCVISIYASCTFVLLPK
mgnify:CR=1 FL=1